VKSKSQVKKRLQQAVYEDRKAFLSDKLSEKPCNCVHNHLHTDDLQSFRICMLGSSDLQNWAGTICDTVETATQCPFYTPRQTRSEALELFNAKLAQLDSDIVSNEVCVLTWILEES
jgi:hypothetical protein